MILLCRRKTQFGVVGKTFVEDLIAGVFCHSRQDGRARGDGCTGEWLSQLNHVLDGVISIDLAAEDEFIANSNGQVTGFVELLYEFVQERFRRFPKTVVLYEG